MKPTRTSTIPTGPEWAYELKYDGYRAFLDWNGTTASLTSKSGLAMDPQFPEIIETAQCCFSSAASFTLDGELVVLENGGKADFYTLQSRFRASTAKADLPASFLCFDCLNLEGEPLTRLPYKTRKEHLRTIMQQAGLPSEPAPHAPYHIQFIPAGYDLFEKMKQCRLYRSEGIVAKASHSFYKEGRTTNWLKYKTPYSGTCFITAYDPDNDYFHLGVFHQFDVQPAGKCAHGLSSKEQAALIQTVKKNGTWDPAAKLYQIDPSIVVEVNYTSQKKEELREPRFSRILFQTQPKTCTSTSWQTEALRFPDSVYITHPEKPLWPDNLVHKLDFLHYVRTAAPFILPFLQERALTVIRYPHGTLSDGFFQKECPDYAPSFIDTKTLDDTSYIVCNKLETLLWLANQLALEWHIPFKRVTAECVDEVVFDLDPPGVSHFSSAIDGALFIKDVLDSFELESFVKFSGNKGLQIYIPLPAGTFTWQDTGVFTRAIGKLAVSRRPELFTTERLKKNRKEKLYIDIPQHADGKTIVAPYSLRGNQEPLIACPLFWEEITHSLDRSSFTMETVLQRLRLYGCPFQRWNGERNRQPLERLLQVLQTSNT